MVKQLTSYAASAVVALALSAGFAAAADEQKPSAQTQSQSAQTPAATGQSGQTQSEKLSRHDREFLMEAAQGGLMEVEIAKLAMERASNADVKSFAETLHRDHTAANQKLQQIAQQKGVQLPTELDSKHRREVDKLSKLQGQEFDKAFIRQAGLKDHRADIKKFEKEAKDGTDPQLKAFAQETLPTLKNHLAMAEKISGSSTARSNSQHGTPQASTQENSGASAERKQQ